MGAFAHRHLEKIQKNAKTFRPSQRTSLEITLTLAYLRDIYSTQA